MSRSMGGLSVTDQVTDKPVKHGELHSSLLMKAKNWGEQILESNLKKTESKL